MTGENKRFVFSLTARSSSDSTERRSRATLVWLESRWSPGYDCGLRFDKWESPVQATTPGASSGDPIVGSPGQPAMSRRIRTVGSSALERNS